jgi:hypothetical protein
MVRLPNGAELLPSTTRQSIFVRYRSGLKGAAQMSTATPLFDRRSPSRRLRHQTNPARDEKNERTQVAIFIGLFSAIAIVMCAAAVVVSGDSLDGKLWLVWLIFLGGLSKLLIANGVFWGMMRQDEQTKVDEAARTRRATRSLPRTTGMLSTPPRPAPPRIVRGRGTLTLAASNPDVARDSRTK